MLEDLLHESGEKPYADKDKGKDEYTVEMGFAVRQVDVGRQYPDEAGQQDGQYEARILRVSVVMALILLPYKTGDFLLSMSQVYIMHDGSIILEPARFEGHRIHVDVNERPDISGDAGYQYLESSAMPLWLKRGESRNRHGL